MAKTKLIASITLASFFAFANPLWADAPGDSVVEFHIAPGTGEGPWNKFNEPVMITMGQTLRIFNDDDIMHTLHTNGSPCEHSPAIRPGTSWDCVTSSKHSAGEEDLYDHEYGPDAQFYVEVQ